MESWSGGRNVYGSCIIHEPAEMQRKKKKILKMTLVVRRGLWKAPVFAQCSPTQCAHYIQSGQCYLEHLPGCAMLRRSS